MNPGFVKAPTDLALGIPNGAVERDAGLTTARAQLEVVRETEAPAR